MTAMKEHILTLPDARLRERSKKVTEINDDVKETIQRMIDASLDWENDHPHEVSAAMAAPQIGEFIRVVVVRDSFDDKANQNFTALINPEVIKAEGSLAKDYEGCLSVPRIYGLVERPNKVRMKATLIDGNEVRFKADGSLARILQHEVDHTKGVVFIDHIRDDKDAFFELDDDGELQPLDYDSEIKNNRELWEDEA
jgi:peptide deformylase